MPGSLRLGKIAGIVCMRILGWFIVLVLLTWSLASGWFAQASTGWPTSISWIAAFISALLLFVCVLVHELAHALVARAHGLSIKHITLFLFCGLARMEEEMKRRGVEFQVAAIGPLELLLAFVAFLLGEPLRGTGSPRRSRAPLPGGVKLLVGCRQPHPRVPTRWGSCPALPHLEGDGECPTSDVYRLLRRAGLCVCLHPVASSGSLRGTSWWPVDGLHRLVPVERGANCQEAGSPSGRTARRLG